MNYDLTVVIPTINPDRLSSVIKQINDSSFPFKTEIIAIGPIEETSHDNFKSISDYGSPSRCFQRAASQSSGKYICNIPDDVIIHPHSLRECISFLNSFETEKRIALTIRYSEGPGFTGNQHLDDSYWIARTHGDLQLPGVKHGWRIAPLFMYKLDEYKTLGGLDCRFEHINLNTHDLAFRFQKSGGEIHLSPVHVLSADWNPADYQGNSNPIHLAYSQNDLPLQRMLYSEDSDRIFIDYDNWKNEPPVWPRKYNK